MFSFIAKRLPSNNRLERIWKLAQVDFQGRYYNDRLGLLWALIKPVFEAALYYIAFKYLLNIDKENFGLFLFGGIIIWMAFAEGTSRSINLLSNKSYLIENVQFSHIDLYFAHTISIFFALFFNMAVFALVSIFMGQNISLEYLLIPVVFLSIFLLILALSLVLSTLQPFVKDITHMWDMLLLSGFWASAVFFEPEVIFEKAPIFAYLNPFIGIIMNIRGAIISNYEMDYFWLIFNLGYSIVAFLVGFVIFTNYKDTAIEKL